MRILVVKLAALGDVLRTTSVLPALRARYAPCTIDWVTAADAIPLLETNPLLARVFDARDSDIVRVTRPDLVLSLDEDPDGCRLASSAGGRLVGAYLDHGRVAYTDECAPWFDMSLISRLGRAAADRLKLANTRTYPALLHEMLGLEYRGEPPMLDLPSASVARASRVVDERLQDPSRIVGLNAGAGGRWLDKRLPVPVAADLVHRLANAGTSVLLLGGPEERAQNTEILRRAGTSRVADAGCDHGILDFAALVGCCAVVVTSDSLALHIAVARRVPAVALFYPTSPAEIDLCGGGVKIVAEGRSRAAYEAISSDPPRWNTANIASHVEALLPAR